MDIKRYRIGNDLTVFWAINNRDGSPFDLEGKEVRLYISHPRGREEVAFELSTLPDGSINNVIRWDFAGEDQRTLGLYTLTIEIRNSTDHKEIKKDYCAAFVLVGKSCEESADEGEANIMDGGELYLASQLDIYMLHVSGGSGDSGLIKKVYKESDFGGSFNSVSVSDTFNAHAINALYKRLNALATPSMGSLSDVELAALANEDVLIWDGSNFINTSAKELIEKYGGTGGSGGTVDLSEIYDRLTEIESWFELSEDGQTLTTDKNLASMGEVSAGGIAEESYAVSAAAEMPASEGGLAKRIFSVPANTTYFNCVHNLGSRDIIIQVYEDGNGHQMVSPVVYLDNENTARIVFDGPISIGHNVIIIG